jgi:transcriptional regulator with XRE-family HTH domain
MQLIPPLTLAWLTRTLREASNLSQEALALSSGLTTRTIQRVEAGDPSTVTTRRSLARGLGYDNQDVFENPETIQKICEFHREIERMREKAAAEQFPGRVRLPAVRVETGEQLGRLAEQCNAANFHWDEKISQDAKNAAAAIFDYLRDYVDGKDDCSMTLKLQIYEELDGLLRDLQTAGAIVHSALRAANFVGKTWENKTPIRMRIAYVVVDVPDHAVAEIIAAKEFQFA